MLISLPDYIRVKLTKQYIPGKNLTKEPNMSRFVAFVGFRRIATGAKGDVVRALREVHGGRVFDLETGAEVDFDLRDFEVEGVDSVRENENERGRGRPKLGVIAREVTLLPRHWEWLNAQRGGASAALRRLVDAARAADGGATEAEQANGAVYRFLSAMAGDLPGFEEATRALFAGNLSTLRTLTAGWPADVMDVAITRLNEGKSSLST
jgi:uncharacterized protein